MEVILQEDFPSLGYVGDKVSVKGGYARNYLIPRGIAVEAQGRNARMLKHKLTGILAKKAKLKGDAESLASRLNGLILEFTLKAGVKGKSFGSVTVKDIDNSLKEKGFEIDRRQIRLSEPLRKAGEYSVDIKLHSEVHAPITVRVMFERVEQKKEAKEEGSGEGSAKPKRGKKRSSKDEAGETDAAPTETAEADASETDSEAIH